MKNALIHAAVAAFALSSTGCALLSKVPGGNVVSNVGGEGAAIIQQAQAAAKSKCDPIRTAEVAWTEERAMGGVVAVKQASNYGSYFLDGMAPKKPDELAVDAAAKKVSLPDGPKNDMTAYLAVVGRNLAKYSIRPDITWTFGIIENETPNAVSAPGGYVILTTGLLKKIKNEAQLAGVIGHEIGHIVHKHSLKRYRDQKATQCDVATFGGTVVKKGVQSALALLPPEARDAARFADKFDNFDLDNSEGDFVRFIMDAVMKLMDAMGNEKEDEFQADATALELMAFAGYDTTEYEAFLTSLGSSGGGFSKHPSTEDRVAKLKALREGDLAPFAVGKAKPDVAKVFAPLSTAK